MLENRFLDPAHVFTKSNSVVITAHNTIITTIKLQLLLHVLLLLIITIADFLTIILPTVTIPARLQVELECKADWRLPGAWRLGPATAAARRNSFLLGLSRE